MLFKQLLPPIRQTDQIPSTLHFQRAASRRHGHPDTVELLFNTILPFHENCVTERVAGPTMFNALSDDLRDPRVSTTFGQSMKTHLFSAYQHV